MRSDYGDEMSQVNIDFLTTEKKNSRTLHLDSMSTLEIIKVMNEEDFVVVEAVKKVLPQIEKCIGKVIDALNQGGRLIYVGAGTSGRIGILDAVECVPTFSTTNEVIGIIAGGNKAFVSAVEGAEDSEILARDDLMKVNLSDKDVVVAITASGRTPYAIGALMYANKVSAFTIGISCNTNTKLSKHSNIAIEVDLGPEILTGSTRLKAGTAQKMILNMISTSSMVGIGKVLGNLMVDMKPTNSKLMERAIRIITEISGCSRKLAEITLLQANYQIKPAIVMLLSDINYDEATQRLNAKNGFIRDCIY